MVKVVVDAIGGDYIPGRMAAEAVEAVNAKPGIQVFLVEQEQAVVPELSRHTYNKDQIWVVDATEVIATEEPPVNITRKKKDSSVAVGLDLVKQGEADAFVSAGSPGTTLVNGQTIMGRNKGVEYPPLAPFIPTGKGMSLLANCGANVGARASHPARSARMGSIYMEHMMGIKSPQAAIASIDAKEKKSNTLVREAFPLLEGCKGTSFIGSIEAREIPHGGANIIACKAFMGNIILKLYEGVGATLISMMKGGMMSTPRSEIGALLIKPILRKTLKSFNGSQYDGAPLLGLKGLVVKTRGGSKHTEVRNSVTQCMTFREQDINGRICQCLDV